MQDALLSRLNSVIERSYHCIVPKHCKKKQLVPPSQPRPGRPRVGLPVGDPYKYSSYPETGISEQQPHNPLPYNDIIGDRYFDDSGDDNADINQNDTNEQHDFDFDDLILFLEDDSDEYDLDSAFRHYEGEAGYQDKGEVHTLVPATANQVHDPAVLRPMTPPHQSCGRITMPCRRLPAEEGEAGIEGAVRGDIWEAPASLEAQTTFFSRLLDEIEAYTASAEVTQRSIQGLAPEVQQPVQAELRRKAQHLQDQLVWAEKTLAPQAILDAKLERAFQPARPLIPVTPPIRRSSPACPAPPPPQSSDGDRGGRSSRARHGRVERPTPATPSMPRRTRSQDPAGSTSQGRAPPR